MQKSISNKEIKALRVIRSFLMKNGRMPSVRELMKEMSYKSPRSAAVILQQLIDKKILTKKQDGSLRFTQYEFEEEMPGEQTVKIPLLGTVACGSPILAEENIEAMIAVSTKMVKPSNQYFLLRANGDSMNEKGINPGDLVLVKQQTTAENGDIVVALIDDEATIKELRINQENVLLLPHSSNREHTPIILTKDFKVQGVVITTIPGYTK
ncbi:MAG: transcriptional repressor LexA [Bacteroidales bacterium]|jgi:repressor LexA|nr:transcriptional repressor LexA [Bacteroidales bacterium]